MVIALPQDSAPVAVICHQECGEKYTSSDRIAGVHDPLETYRERSILPRQAVEQKIETRLSL